MENITTYVGCPEHKVTNGQVSSDNNFSLRIIPSLRQFADVFIYFLKFSRQLFTLKKTICPRRVST